MGRQRDLGPPRWQPHQIVEATFDDKRSALDWTTDELVAFLNERRADRDGAPEKEESDPKSDRVH
jgi:hypothetical protein